MKLMLFQSTLLNLPAMNWANQLSKLMETWHFLAEGLMLILMFYRLIVAKAI